MYIELSWSPVLSATTKQCPRPSLDSRSGITRRGCCAKSVVVHFWPFQNCHDMNISMMIGRLLDVTNVGLNTSLRPLWDFTLWANTVKASIVNAVILGLIHLASVCATDAPVSNTCHGCLDGDNSCYVTESFISKDIFGFVLHFMWFACLG